MYILLIDYTVKFITKVMFYENPFKFLASGPFSFGNSSLPVLLTCTRQVWKALVSYKKSLCATEQFIPGSDFGNVSALE